MLFTPRCFLSVVLTGMCIVAPLMFLGAPTPVSGALPPIEQIEQDLAGPYKTTAAKPVVRHRGEVMRGLEPVMIQQARHVASLLRPWAKDPAAEFMNAEGKQSAENDIRGNSHGAFGFAVIYHAFPDEAFTSDFTREQARQKSVAILRYVVPTHGAGGMTRTDGKQWSAPEHQWQRSFWAWIAGETAWLMWDDLSPQLKWCTARMICDEADRWAGKEPPAQVHGDTKAEENAWNADVVALAYNMFPNHPRREEYGETARRWFLSSFLTAKDVERNPVIDGKSIRDWNIKPNIFDDYTLENHARVHPDYMTTTTQMTYQTLPFEWAGSPVPQALTFNVDKVYASSLALTFPDAGWIYPSGQDWGLHRNADWLQYHAAAAVLFNDARAARMMRVNLRAIQKMAARDPGGGINKGSEATSSPPHARVLHWLADPYLLMAAKGEGPEPVSEDQLWKDLSGTHLFEAGKFGLLRTERSISTFSWGTQVMGMVLPLRQDLLFTPHPRSLIGIVGMPGAKGEKLRVQDVRVATIPNSLGVAGVLSRGEGALEQRFGFLALPDGRTIYADVVLLIGDRKPARLDLGTLGVLNDRDWPFHDGSRTLAFEGGERTFSATDSDREEQATLSSRWYNLDDGLGIVALNASGRQAYHPKPTGAAGRLEQLFHLNQIDVASLPRSPDPSMPIAHGVFVFYPAQSADETKSMAASCRLHSAPGARIVELSLDDQTYITFDLDALKITAARDHSGTAAKPAPAR